MSSRVQAIAEAARQFAFQRDQHHGWRRAASWLLLTNALTAATFAGYVFFHSTVYITVAATPDGRLVPLTRLDEPIMSDAALRNWTVAAVTEAFTLGHHDWRLRLASIRGKFTDSGYESFLAGLDDSLFLDRLRDNLQVASAVARGAPVITDTRHFAGRIGWAIEFPLLVSRFRSGETSGLKRGEGSPSDSVASGRASEGAPSAPLWSSLGWNARSTQFARSGSFLPVRAFRQASARSTRVLTSPASKSASLSLRFHHGPRCAQNTDVARSPPTPLLRLSERERQRRRRTTRTARDVDPQRPRARRPRHLRPVPGRPRRGADGDCRGADGDCEPRNPARPLDGRHRHRHRGADRRHPAFRRKVEDLRSRRRPRPRRRCGPRSSQPRSPTCRRRPTTYPVEHARMPCTGGPSPDGLRHGPGWRIAASRICRNDCCASGRYGSHALPRVAAGRNDVRDAGDAVHRSDRRPPVGSPEAAGPGGPPGSGVRGVPPAATVTPAATGVGPDCARRRGRVRPPGG